MSNDHVHSFQGDHYKTVLKESGWSSAWLAKDREIIA